MKRVIPCLLLQGERLVKTVRFQKPTYVGDPINTVRIFNEKEVDELIFLDILASAGHGSPNFALLERIVNESFMPLSYGGGISSYNFAAKLFELGVEKVILNTAFHDSPDLISCIAKTFGSQAVVVSLDVKYGWGGQHVYRNRGRKRVKGLVVDHAKRAEDLGAGEIFVTSVDRDGVLNGYDLPLVGLVSDSVDVPVVCCGGARNIDDLQDGLKAGAAAVAAGSMFVFHGPHRAVLISYPNHEQMVRI